MTTPATTPIRSPHAGRVTHARMLHPCWLPNQRDRMHGSGSSSVITTRHQAPSRTDRATMRIGLVGTPHGAAEPILRRNTGGEDAPNGSCPQVAHSPVSRPVIGVGRVRYRRRPRVGSRSDPSVWEMAAVAPWWVRRGATTATAEVLTRPWRPVQALRGPRRRSRRCTGSARAAASRMCRAPAGTSRLAKTPDLNSSSSARSPNEASRCSWPTSWPTTPR